MSQDYHIRLASGAIVTFGSPEAIKKSLEMHWPAGQYEILRGPSSGLPHGLAPGPWGVAIKDDCGKVGLEPAPKE